MTKHPLYFSLLLSAALIYLFPSCKSSGNVVRADEYDTETIVDLMNEENPVTNQNTDRNTPSRPKKSANAPSPIDGDWTVVAVHGKNIDIDGDMPYVVFESSTGRFYASNGCNILNGNYTYADNAITFSQVTSSLKRCPDTECTKAISSVIADGTKVKTKIENKNRETYLYVYSHGTSPVLTLRRHNLETINGFWTVLDICGSKIEDEAINIFFDIPEHYVHGNTGCNFFNGSISIDPGVASSISFSQMGVTMKYCDNAETEQKFLVALEETATYELNGNNTLVFISSKGKQLLTLKRVTKQ